MLLTVTALAFIVLTSTQKAWPSVLAFGLVIVVICVT